MQCQHQQGRCAWAPLARVASAASMDTRSSGPGSSSRLGGRRRRPWSGHLRGIDDAEKERDLLVGGARSGPADR